MYCSFCGHQVRDGALFCSECGRNLTTGKAKNETKKAPPSKKVWIPVLAGVIVIALVIAVISSISPASTSTSIVGVWMDGTDRVIFTEAGDYKDGLNYGTYAITSDKTLEIDYGEYSYHSGSTSYKWGSEAMNDSDYWYISGDTLYILGGEYTKK